jgi:hypothetical protein
MGGNWVTIHVHPRDFRLWPPCPEVIAAMQPLAIGIVWDANQNNWESVTVQNFVDEHNAPVAITGAYPVFQESEGNVVKVVNFAHLVIADVYAKYDLLFKRKGSTEIYTVDPTIRLRRLG